MREIKFRALSKEKKEWIYGTGFIPVEINCYKNGEYEMVKGVNYDELDYFAPSYDTEEIEINTLGQFTGLYDKNGTPIYESDIVKNHCGYKAIVKYGKYIYGGITHTGFYIQDKEFNDIFNLMDFNIEVIGNIHDMEENNGK